VSVDRQGVCRRCNGPLIGRVRGGRCEPCRAARFRKVGIGVVVGLGVVAAGAVIVAVGKRDGGWLDVDGYDPNMVLEPGTQIRIDANNYSHLADHPPHLKWATVEQVFARDTDPWYYVRGADGNLYGAQREYIVRARRDA